VLITHGALWCVLVSVINNVTLGVETAPKIDIAITPVNTHSIFERSQYEISNQVICQNIDRS
jgi:hypothetical protein